MEKIKIFLLVLLSFTIILGVSQNLVYGASFNPDDPNYKPSSTTDAQNVGQLENIGNTIVGVIRTVGSLASVAVLIMVGIKYMAGSVEEKAEYKKSMIRYVMGAVFVFGITNILAIIIDLAKLF